MCQFFSFVGDGHGNFRYHDWDDRQKIGVNADPEPDSHTLILTRLNVQPEKQSMWSKYEYNPLNKTFCIDEGVKEHDHESARNWVEALDFQKVIPALRIKPIANPFTVAPPEKITSDHVAMVKKWDSVGASVWDSVLDSVRTSVWDSVGASMWDSVRTRVWDSVGASVGASVWASVRASVGDSVRASVGASVRANVWDSVGAYCASFVGIKYRHDFSPSVKLWEMGLVPSYDGKVWRLHGHKDARVLWTGTFAALKEGK